MENNWNYDLKLKDRGPTDSDFKAKSRKVMKQGYCILEYITDTYRNVPAGIMNSLKVPSDYP